MTVREAGKKGGEIRAETNLGPNNGNAKLTPAMVARIRESKGKRTAKQLAFSYEVSEGHIRRLWRGENWNG